MRDSLKHEPSNLFPHPRINDCSLKEVDNESFSVADITGFYQLIFSSQINQEKKTNSIICHNPDDLFDEEKLSLPLINW